MLLLTVIFLLFVGCLPWWPYSAGWGYYPSAVIALIVLFLLGWLLIRL